MSVAGITCSGCIASIESKIRRHPGIQSIQVNPATHRASVRWDGEALPFERVIRLFSESGYPAVPYQASWQEEDIELERRKALVRIGVAAALGMQVMMISVALYFGEAYGMDPGYQSVLEFAAMLMTLPIMVFAAKPFFMAAASNLGRWTVGVDVPVSIALLAAFFGSVVATFGYPGQVYYESIAMFVFLLLSARFLELGARRNSLNAIFKMEKAVPEMALKWAASGKTERVDIQDLRVGDRIFIGAGEVLPADGVVIGGRSTVDESILTGESEPVHKSAGARVIAGSINLDNDLRVRVGELTENNTVNQIAYLAESAQGTKPRLAKLADGIASRFVGFVLLLAVVAGGYWWFKDQSIWLPVVISTLVIACPCALSLATPTAFIATMGRLTKRGIVPVKGEFLEDIAAVEHICFDKTGTLTIGEPGIHRVTVAPGWDQSGAMDIAAALNRASSHPFAKAFRDGATGRRELNAENIDNTAGSGLTGRINGQWYCIGSTEFVSTQLPGALSPEWSERNGVHSVCLLADSNGVIARFELSDTLRQDAVQTIAALKRRGLSISLLSGDHQNAVAAVAEKLGIADFQSGLSPDGKKEAVKERIARGQGVTVVGDGFNDAPVLASATVSLAMGQGAGLSKRHADVVLLNDRLLDMIEVFDASRRTRRIIKQNMAWAIGYNLLALPAAVSGLVPPWLAAIGMSLSSVVVSVNAVRLSRESGKGPLAAKNPALCEAEVV